MKPSTTFTDRLSLARERLNIALDPAARAARAIFVPGPIFAARRPPGVKARTLGVLRVVAACPVPERFC